MIVVSSVENHSIKTDLVRGEVEVSYVGEIRAFRRRGRKMRGNCLLLFFWGGDSVALAALKSGQEIDHRS